MITMEYLVAGTAVLRR